jgi:hypothetical protein
MDSAIPDKDEYGIQVYRNPTPGKYVRCPDCAEMFKTALHTCQ